MQTTQKATTKAAGNSIAKAGKTAPNKTQTSIPAKRKAKDPIQDLEKTTKEAMGTSKSKAVITIN